eukprot:Platyproteum_vivax@DN14897_c0_g1_i1.p1
MNSLILIYLLVVILWVGVVTGPPTRTEKHIEAVKLFLQEIRPSDINAGDWCPVKKYPTKNQNRPMALGCQVSLPYCDWQASDKLGRCIYLYQPMCGCKAGLLPMECVAHQWTVPEKEGVPGTTIDVGRCRVWSWIWVFIVLGGFILIILCGVALVLLRRHLISKKTRQKIE